MRRTPESFFEDFFGGSEEAIADGNVERNPEADAERAANRASAEAERAAQAAEAAPLIARVKAGTASQADWSRLIELGFARIRPFDPGEEPMVAELIPSPGSPYGDSVDF